MRSSDSIYIAKLIADDPGLRLLRSKNPALTISFLYKAFREKHTQTMLSEKFESLLADFLRQHESADEHCGFDALDDFLESLNEDFQAAVQGPETRAHFLVNKWCRDNVVYIRRYYNEQREPVVELSAGVERLLTWLDNMDSNNFVAAESRFQDILHKLRELSENTTENTQDRIAELKKRRGEIQAQIREIEKTGRAEIYTPVKMLEQLNEVARASRELLSDFRQVEENFRIILADVYKKQASRSNKGEILGYALDANQEMHATPQGQSFDSFWMFLVADAGKNEINQLARSILSQVDNFGIEWEDTFLMHLKKYLHEAGKKIIDANHILAGRLNRVLLSQTRNEHKRLMELMYDIKKASFELAENPPASDNFMQLETRANLNFPQARQIMLPVLERSFEELKTFDLSSSDELLQDTGIFHQFYVDEQILKNNIEAYRQNFSHISLQFSLAELLNEFPIKKGLAEVLAYFSIASKLQSAVIIENKIECVSYFSSDRKIELTIPKLVFA